MGNSIEETRKNRASIINSYSSKPKQSTYVDELAQLDKETQHVVVKEIIEETSDTKSFILAPNREKGTNSLSYFKSGQYISVKLCIDNNYTTRAYSISSEPSTSYYKITIKRVKNGYVSKYMLDNIKEGDYLEISKPLGTFYYSKIRDEQNVIAIAGGSGITPFMSLAESIIEGEEDCLLTVFYSVKTESDIIFKKRIEEINKKSKKVKFVITLTREEKEGYLHGHIDENMLEPYIKEFNTVFMCGPKELYKAMNEVLGSFNIPRKSVHYENFNISYEPSEEKTYELKVILKHDFVLSKCKSNETLLEAMERAGVKAPSACRVGTCGYCKSILLEGKVKMIGNYLKRAESNNDYIHPCIAYPESNIVLRLDI